jgi:hypothetical protein
MYSLSDSTFASCGRGKWPIKSRKGRRFFEGPEPSTNAITTQQTIVNLIFLILMIDLTSLGLSYKVLYSMNRMNTFEWKDRCSLDDVMNK